MTDWPLLTRQTLAAVARRPGRSFATALGVALGVAVFLATVGWSQTVGARINQTFDELAATTLRVRDARAETASDAALPDDLEARLRAVSGVVDGGRYVEAGRAAVRTFAGGDPVDLPLIAVDPGYVRAAGLEVASGRLFDDAAVAAGAPAVLLGESAAAALGLGEVRPGQVLLLDRAAVVLAGVLRPSTVAPEADRAVLVPTTAPLGLGGGPPARLGEGALVRVRLGAAGQVANELPLALRPQDPGRLGVLTPPEPAALRADVDSSLDALAYGAAGLSLLVGAVGIMNAMLAAVAQRSAEIGLRRALGAGARHVLAQFLLEGAVLGLLGSVLGTLAGEAALLVAAAVAGCTPVLDHRLLALAPAAGLLLGTLASLYPAARAARLDPARTLRG